MPNATDDKTQCTTRQIAAALGETKPKPIQQIERIVRLIGIEWAQGLLRETLELEARGGMLVPDGSQRRSAGSVYFYLAREHLTPEQVDAVFHPQARAQASVKPGPLRTMGWGERLEVVREAAQRGPP